MKKFAISGASGFVGRALLAELEARGHQVIPLVRTKGGAGIFWDPESGEINRPQLENLDGMFHLAGENVASRRWSKDQKEKIYQSRVKGTTLIVGALSGLAHPPKFLISASASGYYGAAVWKPVDESGPAGSGFLAETCRAWELALRTAPLPQTRIIVTRFGLILGEGGLLAKISPPFRLGLGGKIGNGNQWMSWISLRDIVGALIYVAENETVNGVLNFVSPEPITNVAFTEALAKALHRPAFIPVPAAALRLLLGTEMAEETALSSSRLIPKKLLDLGYHFRDPELGSCLDQIFKKSPVSSSANAESAV